MMKKVSVNLKLLKDIQDLLCSSIKMDWDDVFTSILSKVIKEAEK